MRKRPEGEPLPDPSALLLLSEEELADFRIRQSERRMRRTPKSIEELTNAQIAELTEFKKFCAEKNVEPTKRQAGKLREGFTQWFNERKEL